MITALLVLAGKTPLVSAFVVLAQVVCNLPQCEVCKNIDPDSWLWIFSGCWIIGSSSTLASIGVGTVMAIIARVMVLSAPKGR